MGQTRQRGHKAVLVLTAGQAAKLDDQGHAARAMWNLLHEWWTFRPGQRPTLKQADEAIRQARRDLAWLADLPAQAAQQVLKNYLRAWVNCWEGRAKAPVFKSRVRSRMAVDVPQGRDLHIKRITGHVGEVDLPKVGRVRFRWTKNLPGVTRGGPTGRVTGARLVKEAHGWHIVFPTQTTIPDPGPHPGPRVGIDRGVTVALALSDGHDREHPPWLTSGESERLRRLEKKSARQRRTRERGEQISRRLTRTYDQIARLRAKAKRRAIDWQHQTTTGLATRYGQIKVEDLHITGMTRSAKGTIEAPGKNVAAKAGLNRAIAGQAWGRTVELLAYKVADRGGLLIKVPAPGTSLRCHACDTITPGSRQTQALFACKNTACGWTGNADTNAAMNIMNAAGTVVSGRRDLGVTRSAKRQPPHTA
jgi:putative transposase